MMVVVRLMITYNIYTMTSKNNNRIVLYNVPHLEIMLPNICYITTVPTQKFYCTIYVPSWKFII
jgi:hypothetical protein